MKTMSLKIMLVLVIVSLASSAYAELKLNSVYPNVGEMGKDLTVTLTGKGFDQNTRVSMSLDTTNKRKIVGSVDTPGEARKFDIIGNIAYLADGSGGLQIIDISNSTNPMIIGSVKMPDEARDVKVIGNTAYVADYASGLQVVDVSNPTSPVIIGSVDTPNHAMAVYIRLMWQIGLVGYK
ncbi:MAG: hypothetical protein HC887_06945 [Desulfobacteraceae bacterium]|nr:hypothetical protein [Desulfobacteraceae bacterium]